MDKKIVIATTFRDFNGNANDKIQRLFLKSIKGQTHQNYILAVTVFKEKNVAKVLSEEAIPHIIFQGDAGEHRFSLTQVMLNSIKVAKENKGSILLWTTSDVIFDPSFFEKIAAHTGEQTCGTSYPHTIYHTIEDYMQGKDSKRLWYGIDSIFYSSDVFDKPAGEEALRNYPNEGWGHGDYFFVAFGAAFFRNMINIRRHSKIQKITNDRKAAGETGGYFGADSTNRSMYRKFLKDYNIKTRWSDSSLFFLMSFRLSSVKDIWIKALGYSIISTHPLRHALGSMIHNMKVAMKSLVGNGKVTSGPDSVS